MNDAYMPFLIGKQNCIGQCLANAVMHALIPQIIANFELEFEDEVKAKYSLTLKPIKTMIEAKKL
jgi:cytochrome P450